jgi:tRNA uridine 5-carboxymethylaminomethyl modification enzyme
MFTSRAEYRLRLRQDNCDIRLTTKALDLGLACRHRAESFQEKKKNLETIKSEATVIQVDGITLAQWLKRTENTPGQLPPELKGRFHEEVWEILETDLKYEGYLKREQDQIDRQRNQESQRIPTGLDYGAIPSLRLEARQKLREYTPETLGQASRISGITPADISVLSVWMKKTAPRIPKGIH